MRSRVLTHLEKGVQGRGRRKDGERADPEEGEEQPSADPEAPNHRADASIVKRVVTSAAFSRPGWAAYSFGTYLPCFQTYQRNAVEVRSPFLSKRILPSTVSNWWLRRAAITFWESSEPALVTAWAHAWMPP